MTSASAKSDHASLEAILDLPDVRRTLEEGELTERKKVAFILGHLPPSSGVDLASAIHDIQAVLVKAGYLRDVRLAGYRPPPQHLHAREDALKKLDLYESLQRTLDNLPTKLSGTDPHRLRAAILIVLLAIECGAHSHEELSSTLRTLATTGMREINGFYYVCLSHSTSKGGLADARRLFLSPATAVAALLTPPPLLMEAASAPNTILLPLATMLGRESLEIKDVIDAASTQLEFAHSPPRWLMYWMLNKRILSSNLVESVFLRVNKCTAEYPPEDNAGLATGANNDIDITDDPELDVGQAEDTDRIDAFTRVNAILRKPQPREHTRRDLEALEAEFNILGERHPGAQQLYGWVLYLAGTRMATSSIRRLWTAIATRIIAIVPEQHLDTLSADQWEQALSVIADSSQSASTRAITAQALNSLGEFLNMAYAAEMRRLPSGKQVSLANARIITPGEIGSITHYLRSVFTILPPPLRKASINLINVGWHTGLRRQELFHLRASDIKGSKLPIIEVRDSDINPLKSLSSCRNVPLDLLKTLPTHLSGFSPVELPREGSGLLFQSSAADDRSVIPGSAKHHALIQRIVTGIHHAMREATGDKDAVLHVLRHSFATYCLIAILGERLGLGALAAYFPFLQEALDKEFVTNIRKLLLPPSYEGNSELEIIRDLMGHASELTTLAHYVHCLDFFRLGILRPSWRSDPRLIGRMMGIPRSTLGHAKTMNDLMQLATRRSTMCIISAQSVAATNREETWEDVTALMRGLSAAMSTPHSATPDQIHKRLSALDRLDIPYQDNGLRFRREQIEPLAIAFFPTSKRPTGLTDLLPSGESVRIAASACQQLLTTIRAQPNRCEFAKKLTNDCIDLLKRRTTASSSTVTVHSLQELMAIDNVVSALTPNSNSALRYRIRQAQEKDMLTDVCRKAAEQHITENTAANRTLYVTIRFGKEENDRSDTATFIWLLSSLYIIFG